MTDEQWDKLDYFLFQTCHLAEQIAACAKEMGAGRRRYKDGDALSDGDTLMMAANCLQNRVAPILDGLQEEKEIIVKVERVS